MKGEVPLLLKFLDGAHCLIVEPSQAFLSSLQAGLRAMGVPQDQIVVARKFVDARNLIDEKKPRLLVTEYELDGHFGLQLIEQMEKHHPQNSRVSIIATKNSSDSAVAEAAEEQVDAYILKPFSPDGFQTKLLSTVLRKVSPSPYSKKIQAGKKELEDHHLDEAINEFLGAKFLDTAPSLACFYAGQAYQAKGMKAEALQQFKAGRQFKPLHYRCLIGEFESLIEEKRYGDAYKVVGTIRDNYPITSHRLGQIFIAVVFTFHFDDIPTFYELFKKMEQRPPELIKLTSLALLTAGRYTIKESGNVKKAAGFFEMGVVATGRSFQFLELVINELLKAKAHVEAQEFLSKIDPSEMATPSYLQLSFRIDELTLTKDQVVEKGRKLILAGNGTPEIFRSVITAVVSSGKTTMAETLISAAVKTHPDLRKSLYDILENKISAA